MTSPTHIGYVARRRIEHGLIVTIEWSACQLRADDASALPADELHDLGAKSEPITISELTQGIPGLDRNLDRSRCRHTQKHIYEGSTAVVAPRTAFEGSTNSQVEPL